MRKLIVLFAACLCLLHAHPLNAEDGHYVNQFLVELHKRSTLDDLLADHGFEVEEDLPSLGFVVLRHKEVSHRSKRSAVDHVNKLRTDYRVKLAEQQKELIRVKREIIHDKQVELPFKHITDNSIYYRSEPSRLIRKDGIPNPEIKFNDPFYKDQWYCHNDGQTGGEVDVDLNVVLSWKNGYTGVNITICILDDGIDHTHPDIKNNYRPDLSADMNDKSDNDPMPDVSNSDNSHGTRCAGEIVGAANNNNCGVGIAYGAGIGGIRILDGPITDVLEGKALEFKRQDIDIYSASWGPRDNGATTEAPGAASIRAIEKGVREGRGGKGNIFVWASGNGGGNDDDCNCDGYVGMPETISIGSITDRGGTPYFMEKCPSTFAVVPSGGEEHIGEDGNRTKIRVVTTDIGGGCIENFEGTSAAAPLAAGALALVLEANNDLTWRDVQHIIAKGSRIPSVTDDWEVNGAGYHRSHSFGFGVMDVSLMVQMAIGWKNVPEAGKCNSSDHVVNKDVPADGCITEHVDMSFCQDNHNTHIEHLEHTMLWVDIESGRRGDVSITLTSPFGTVSQMLSTRKEDNSADGLNFQLMSLNNWGENIVGEKTWKIEVCDNGKESANNNMKLNSYSLIALGTSDSPNKRSTDSFEPSKAAVAEMKELELKRGKRLNMKRHTEGFQKKTDKNTAKKDVKNEKKEEEQKYLKDVIHDMSSYLQEKGFDENHVIDILNHGMSYSSKVRKDQQNGRRGLSRRTFGEEDIDHDKFIDGMSKAVNNIFDKREKERREQAVREKLAVKAKERREKAEEKRKEQAEQEKEKREEQAEQEKKKREEIAEKEREIQEQEKREKETREEFAERYLDEFLEKPGDATVDDIEEVICDLRKILQNRK